jgi:hypothetical protein
MSFATGENYPPIGQGLFNAMRLVLPKGGTVLELGSGDGSTTELKGAGYTVYSIEHSPHYLHRWNTPEFTIHAPFDDTGFYDMNKVRAGIPKNYDILLIDGPDTENRVIRFYEHAIDSFNPKVHWFFDDWGSEMSIGIKAVAKKTERELLVFEDKIKQYAVLLPC